MTTEFNIDLSIAFTLVEDIIADLRAARDQLPGLEDARQAAQQLRDDRLATRNQLLDDLTELQALLQQFVVVNNQVENDPVVVEARNIRNGAQQVVNAAQAERNAGGCKPNCVTAHDFVT